MNAKKSKKLRKIAKTLRTVDFNLKTLKGKPTVLHPKSFKYINKVLKKKLPKDVFKLKTEMLTSLVMSQCEAREKELLVAGYKF